MRIGGWGKTNQKGVLGVDKTPGELISKRGVVETANQKGVLGVGKTPEDPKSKWGKGNGQPVMDLGVGKTPEEPKSKRGGWKNDQPEGSPRGG